MSRIYATEDDTGRRCLVRLECDGPGCEATIKPHPEIAKSGWTMRGIDFGPGRDGLEWDYCEECSESYAISGPS